MDERIHKWIAETYQRAGYHYPAQFLAHIAENAMKNEYHNFSDKTVENALEIGDIANRRKATKFSIIRATKDLKEDRAGLRDALKEGLITKEVYERLLEETYADHKEVAKRHLHSMKIEEIRKKLKEQATSGCFSYKPKERQ